MHTTPLMAALPTASFNGIKEQPTAAWEICDRCGALFKPGASCKNCSPTRCSFAFRLSR